MPARRRTEPERELASGHSYIRGVQQASRRPYRHFSFQCSPRAETFTGKLALSIILGGIATYAARQSANHRRREERARDLQLELTAFAPFIEPLSAEQQEEERVIMTRKTFGKTTTAEKQAEEPGPTALSLLLRRKAEEA